MNEKFGQFNWKCWKDEKPDEDKPVYVYADDIEGDRVSVGYIDDFHVNEDVYWCYVFIPDAPRLCKVSSKTMHDISNSFKDLAIIVSRLENRIMKIEEKLRAK